MHCSYYIILQSRSRDGGLLSLPEETTAMNFDMLLYSMVLLIKNDNNLYLYCGIIAEFY